jgi:hypothetical protein
MRSPTFSLEIGISDHRVEGFINRTNFNQWLQVSGIQFQNGESIKRLFYRRIYESIFSRSIINMFNKKPTALISVHVDKSGVLRFLIVNCILDNACLNRTIGQFCIWIAIITYSNPYEAILNTYLVIIWTSVT